MLQYGDSGETVVNLQNQLKQAGCLSQDASSDGIYGRRTRAAVTKLQQQNGLLADGITGKQTYTALAKRQTCDSDSAEGGLKLGSNGKEVQLLQIQLNNWGFPWNGAKLNPTGVFDIATQKALQEFELFFGLQPDGMLDVQDSRILWTFRGQALANLLTQKDENLADRGKNALKALGANGVPYFIPFLKIDNLYCSSAAITLGKMGANAKAAIPVLIKLLQLPGYTDDIDPCGASSALVFIGLKEKNLVVPDLVALLDSPDQDVRVRAAFALGQIGSEAKDAVPKLIQLLDSSNDRDRHGAISALGQIGSEAKDAVPKLIQLLDSKDDFERSEAASALGGIGSEARSAVPKLIQLLDSSNDSRFTRSYFFALGGIGSEARSAVPKLIQLLDLPNADVPLVADTLGSIGPEARSAVPKLIQLLDSPNADDRYAAASALGKFGSESKNAVPKLQSWLTNKDNRDDYPVILALMRIQPNTSVLQRLEQLLASQTLNLDDRANMTVSVIEIGSPSATSVLLKALNSNNNEIRSTVAVAVGFMESIDQQLVDQLLEIMSNEQENLELRTKAAYSLERLNKKSQDVQRFYQGYHLRSLAQANASCPPWGDYSGDKVGNATSYFFDPFLGQCQLRREGGGPLGYVRLCQGKKC